ncbi:hypothetical protein AG1IA_07813 [Rhizoctonia solani AG-1 IA]|uniref:Uncharacterized protein n=1 Tax=Thanatephorus cucumeris (strain AG1-IA) TaxID=983506 RepID=L8WMZ4_THACA|nr:hypothetical protein AG1IA_07813 [Rhizoctonia solani AG-1 IA]
MLVRAHHPPLVAKVVLQEAWIPGVERIAYDQLALGSDRLMQTQGEFDNWVIMKDLSETLFVADIVKHAQGPFASYHHRWVEGSGLPLIPPTPPAFTGATYSTGRCAVVVPPSWALTLLPARRALLFFSDPYYPLTCRFCALLPVLYTCAVSTRPGPYAPSGLPRSHVAR